MKTKQTVGIILAVIILVVMFFIPATESLSTAGIKTIFMMIAFLVLLITEPFHIMHTCLIFLGLMPLLGVAPTLADALSGIGNPVIIFVVASFGIATAFTGVPLSKRILIAILSKFGKNINLMLLAIMFSAAIVSFFVSNVPTCAIFMAISLDFLELYENPDDKKKTGRAFMLAVPIASMIGGLMTPTGSTIHLLALTQLESLTGKTVSFVQWIAAGVPLTLIILPIAWFIILKINKPAEINHEMVRSFISKLDVPDKITTPEIKILIITGMMLVLWILSSWFKGINIMVVTLLGACFYCLPQIKALDFKTYLNGIGWPSAFLIATVISLGNLMVKNGVSAWIVSFMPQTNMATPILLAFTATLIFLMLVVIPVAPSLIQIMSAPLVALAAASSSSPELVIIIMSMCGCCCFLLPLDTVPLLTYGTGYYSMKDMIKSSLPIQIFMVIVMSLWLTVIGKVFGMV